MDSEEIAAWVAAKQANKNARKHEAKRTLVMKVLHMVRKTAPDTDLRRKVVYLYEVITNVRPRMVGVPNPENPMVFDPQVLLPEIRNEEDAVVQAAEDALELEAEIQELIDEVLAEYELAWNEINEESEEPPE